MQQVMIPGPAGPIEAVIEHHPSPRGLALVCHPHPLQGGTMDNKVVTTLGKAFAELGCSVARFNFRGVGSSAGAWDEGRGEADDARAVLVYLRNNSDAALPLVLAGFSFGSFIAATIAPECSPLRLVLVGTAVSRFAVPSVSTSTVLIHGEADDVVPLADVLNWARPQHIPVTVFPGAGHFFHGQLITLRTMTKTLAMF
jgi:uncharacterized protein